MKELALFLSLVLLLATGCSGGGGSSPPQAAVDVTPVAVSLAKDAPLEAALDAEARAAATALDLDEAEQRALRALVAEELEALARAVQAAEENPERGLDHDAFEALVAERTKALHARAAELLPPAKRDRYRALAGE